ncbi:hypothetical protein M3Y95_00074400 [Aphelenchoides besseyi]|nr:hypothetical protein M3Y95_00074400 [Aphelenchoides besseyi]
MFYSQLSDSTNTKTNGQRAHNRVVIINADRDMCVVGCWSIIHYSFYSMDSRSGEAAPEVDYLVPTGQQILYNESCEVKQSVPIGQRFGVQTSLSEPHAITILFVSRIAESFEQKVRTKFGRQFA